MTSALAPRTDFPVLKELTYLNTGSIGLIPLPVQFEAQRIEREIAVRGTTWFDEEVEIGITRRAREAGARLLNVEASKVAVTSSATEALAQIAWAIRPGAGANVVSIDLEFPSVTYPWLRVAAETGAEVRLAQHRDDPASLSIDSIAALCDERTEAISVSHVQYSTGFRFDLAQLAELARGCGARLIVDVSQSAGQVPVDPAGIAALICTGYKWLCGPFGAAVCWLSEELLEGPDPHFVGWRSAPDPYAMDARRLVLAPDARKLEFSTMSYGAAEALGAAIEYVLALGVEEIQRHDLALARELAEGLTRLGAVVQTPQDDAHRAGIVTAAFPGRDGERLAAALNAVGVIVSPRAGATRFSAHVFNDSDDVARALDAVEAAR